jgi:hypothetical protein
MSTLDKYKEVKVLVAVPSTGTWNEKTGMCLIAMITHFMTTSLGEFKRQSVLPMSIKGSILANKRVDAVKQLFEQKATHLLFIDADQTFPKTTLHRLLSHEKEVVAANIAVKRIPSVPTARGVPAPGQTWREAPLIFTDEGNNSLQEAGRIGCGLILIERKVFEATGLNVFSQPWIESEQKYQGEDWSMCEAIQAAGFKIWIDHGLSNVVGHIGDFEFTHDVVGVVEEKPQLQVVSG